MFPIVVGLLFTIIAFIPPIIGVLFSLLVITYWFWVGTRFAGDIHNPFKAILLANAMGVISLALYFWQFFIASDNNRNLILAGFSQLFSAPLSFLSARIGILFTPDEVNQTTFLVMQIVGLIIMIMVFSMGYVYKKWMQPLCKSS